MEKYKISVVVPIYNVEDYLKKCIESIVEQTYKNLEIILVDDGSIDNSLNICRQYQKKDARIHIIHKENGGLVAARKTGIEAATGDYIAFVDGDDWIEENAFEMITKESNFEDVLMFGLQEDYGYKVVKKTNQIDLGFYQENQIEEIILKMLCDGTFFAFGVLPNLVCKVIKASLLKKIANNISHKITMGEDAVFSYSTIAEAKTVRNINVMPYHYIQRSNSMVRTFTDSSSIIALYQNMLGVNVPENLKKQWEEQIYAYMTFVLQLKCTDIFTKETSFYAQLQGKKVVIYGAGNYGMAVQNALSQNMSVEVVGIADRDYQEIRKSYPEVIAPEEILNLDYDYIYIGILNEKICAAVKEQLVQMGIQGDNILYYKMQDVNADDVRKVLENIHK